MWPFTLAVLEPRSTSHAGLGHNSSWQITLDVGGNNAVASDSKHLFQETKRPNKCFVSRCSGFQSLSEQPWIIWPHSSNPRQSQIDPISPIVCLHWSDLTTVQLISFGIAAVNHNTWHLAKRYGGWRFTGPSGKTTGTASVPLERSRSLFGEKKSIRWVHNQDKLPT